MWKSEVMIRERAALAFALSLFLPLRFSQIILVEASTAPDYAKGAKSGQIMPGIILNNLMCLVNECVKWR